VLGYAEYEAGELEHRLQLQVNPATDRLVYDQQAAALQARGVLENRRQSIAITLNKVRYFLTAERPLPPLKSSARGIAAVAAAQVHMKAR
jgi:hypothetical protein